MFKRLTLSADSLLVYVVLAVSLAGNVYLTMRVLRPAVTVNSELAAGTVIPPLTLSLDGRDDTYTVEFKTDPRPVVFYVFSPSCVWCDRNAANVARVAEVAGSRYRFIGVSLAVGAEAYGRQHGITFPVYVGASDGVRRALKLGPTPHTIVVGSDGTVLQSWLGAYTGDAQREVERFFGVTLPGLDAPVLRAEGRPVASNGPTGPKEARPLCVDAAGLVYSRGKIMKINQVWKICDFDGVWQDYKAELPGSRR
jgi:hypothetical protein